MAKKKTKTLKTGSNPSKKVYPTCNTFGWVADFSVLDKTAIKAKEANSKKCWEAIRKREKQLDEIIKLLRRLVK